jgi:hypothetical protein
MKSLRCHLGYHDLEIVDQIDGSVEEGSRPGPIGLQDLTCRRCGAEFHSHLDFAYGRQKPEPGHYDPEAPDV